MLVRNIIKIGKRNNKLLKFPFAGIFPYKGTK